MTDDDHLETESLYVYKLKCFNHLIDQCAQTNIKTSPELHPEANMDVVIGPKRGPAFDPQILERDPYVCIICGTDFGNRISLHVHQLKHHHLFGQADQRNKTPVFECLNCENILGLHNLVKHRCYVKQQDHIKHLQKVLNRDGSAMVCILCRGRVLPSRIHLIIHLIVAHSVNRHPFKCVFCHTKFNSENLMMQEAHAFEHHAPELFILNRKACYKVLRDPKGLIIDTTAPFTCFYDTSKLENIEHFSFPMKSAHRANSPRPGHENGPNEDGFPAREPQQAQQQSKICTARFKCLAEFTTHVCCFHGALMPQNEQNDDRDEDDPEHDLTDLQSATRNIHVPGPTVRELLKSQEAGFRVNRTTSDDDLSTDFALRKPLSSSPIRMDTKSKYRSRESSKMFKEQCRICLEKFENVQKLKDHAMNEHYPAIRKRLEHLVAKDKLSRILDLNYLCPECYILYRDMLALQIHMMVCHAGKDWRHCGICNYEFFSDTCGNPVHLRLTPFRAPESDKDQLANNLDNQNSIDIWPLSSELMWRIIMAHEMRHRERLFPPKQVPYMPTALFEQLINSQAIQAGLASNWILKKVKQELEGVSNDAVDDKDDLYGPSTAQQAFIQNQAIVKSTSLDRQIVIEALETLKAIMEPIDEPTQSRQPYHHHHQHHQQQQQQPSHMQQDNGESQKGEENQSDQKQMIKSEKSMSRNEYQYQLPEWLSKAFSEIGERNLMKQAELDFEENS